MLVIRTKMGEGGGERGREREKEKNFKREREKERKREREKERKREGEGIRHMVGLGIDIQHAPPTFKMASPHESPVLSRSILRVTLTRSRAASMMPTRM